MPSLNHLPRTSGFQPYSLISKPGSTWICAWGRTLIFHYPFLAPLFFATCMPTSATIAASLAKHLRQTTQQPWRIVECSQNVVLCIPSTFWFLSSGSSWVIVVMEHVHSRTSTLCAPIQFPSYLCFQYEDKSCDRIFVNSLDLAITCCGIFGSQMFINISIYCIICNQICLPVPHTPR